MACADFSGMEANILLVTSARSVRSPLSWMTPADSIFTGRLVSRSPPVPMVYTPLPAVSGKVSVRLTKTKGCSALQLSINWFNVSKPVVQFVRGRCLSRLPYVDQAQAMR